MTLDAMAITDDFGDIEYGDNGGNRFCTRWDIRFTSGTQLRDSGSPGYDVTRRLAMVTYVRMDYER